MYIGDYVQEKRRSRKKLLSLRFLKKRNTLMIRKQLM
jgi:hypothetical protein